MPFSRLPPPQVMKMMCGEGKRLQLPEHSALPKESQGFAGLEAYEALVSLASSFEQIMMNK